MADTAREQLHWQKSFADLEALVVSGQHEACRTHLDAIQPKAIPRSFAAKFAQLASRVHHSIFALKVLHRFIYPETPLLGPATSAEKMIYGYALTNLGAVAEAIEFFDSVPVEEEPEVLVQKAMAHFAEWDYVKAVPFLKAFIARPGVPAYRRTVALVNLAAAHVCNENYAEALELIAHLIDNCRADDHRLLLGNTYELQAQSYFFLGDYERALESLALSRELLKEQNGFYLFMADKWLALCRAFQSRSDEDLRNLRALKAQAVRLNYWDTARDLEMFEARLLSDEELLKKVFVGTPSKGYRTRIRKHFQQSLRAPGNYWLSLGGPALAESFSHFDPTARLSSGEALYEKPQLYLLFNALTLDFYKPSYIGALFKHVYPDEKFNPYTSPSRVLQLLKRLNAWFTAQALPLKVQLRKSEFAIVATGPIKVLIQRGSKISVSDAKWTEAKLALEGRHFSAARLASVLKLSKTSAQQLIKEGLASGKLKATGRGRAITYQFVSRKRHAGFQAA